jgi:hypothetical protein
MIIGVFFVGFQICVLLGFDGFLDLWDFRNFSGCE